MPRAGTYVAGLGLDAGDREDTLLLLDLVAVLPINILWGCSDKIVIWDPSGEDIQQPPPGLAKHAW